ncbi:interferon regulatory factor 1-like isoform X1 [Biomphalaria pfeifferi]|uniref:Interferon regulatory factor 1-like isoform X1 n=1 Tax=Biomphalaria pfeifferi TaxID=112525 RepID=A0AAD8F5U9_BIOPF|nr:interferon regulatory factor 1-like isoform X1 [Biomphalaria pfeifferi]
MFLYKMKERTSRRRRKTVIMPPTLRYRSSSSSNSRVKKGPGSRMRMRAWLEDLLDREECRGLAWVDKTKNIFSVVWRHASSHGFEESEHSDVFYRWAKHTGKYKPNQNNHSSYKSNFRCALHSLKDCIELTKTGDKKGEKAKRTFQFIDPSHPQYKKKKNKKVKAEQESSENSNSRFPDEGDSSFLDLPSSESSSPSCSSLGASHTLVSVSQTSVKQSSVLPQSSLLPQTSLPVQALFSGENIYVPYTDSPVSPTADLSLNRVKPKPQNIVPHLDMLLDSNIPAQDVQTSGRNETVQRPLFMQTETNAEGITTIILHNSQTLTPTLEDLIPNVGAVSSSPQQQSSLSTSGITSENKLYTIYLNPRLTCGGNVKTMKTDSEVMQLPITFSCSSSRQTAYPDSDLEIASNMEVNDSQDLEQDFLSDEFRYTEGDSLANVITEPMYPDDEETLYILSENTDDNSIISHDI